MDFENWFLSNKYTRWYFSIVESGCPEDERYFSVHHIIPRSCGGSDDPSNLVKVSNRQHYVLHLLLTKMMISHDHRMKMVFALRFMSNTFKRYGINRPSSRIIALFHKTIKETPISDAHRANIRNGQLGKKLSEAHKQAISSGLTGRVHSEETKIKISNGNKGKVLPPEQREKLRKAHTGKKLSDEHRKAISQSQKGIKRNSEFCAIMKNAAARFTYTIIHPSGEVEFCTNLKDWCKIHNLSYSSCSTVSRTGGFYHGFHVSRQNLDRGMVKTPACQRCA